MTFQISRDGKIIGAYSHPQITSGLIDGTFRETDYFWTAGMVEWERLALFKELEFEVETEKGNPTPTKQPEDAKPSSPWFNGFGIVPRSQLTEEDRKRVCIGYYLIIVSIFLPYIEAPRYLISNLPTLISVFKGKTHFLCFFPSMERLLDAVFVAYFAGEQIYRVSKKIDLKTAFVGSLAVWGWVYYSIHEVIQTMDIPISSSDPYGRLGEMMAKQMVAVTYGFGFYVFSIGVALVTYVYINRILDNPSAS